MQKQYNFYTRNRPIKEAFIINAVSSNAKEQFRWVIEYCQNVWGGGYNQIILRNDETIETDWWKLLKLYDPDIIKVFDDLPTMIEEKINFNLTPCLIEKIQDYGLQTKGLNIFPNEENIYKQFKLLLFKYKPRVDVDKNLDDFIKFNFGVFQNFDWQQKSIENIQKKEIEEIGTMKDITEVLDKQSAYSYSNHCTKFLSQVCLFSNHHFPKTARPSRTYLTVYTGNDIMDLVTFWNSSILEEPYRQHTFHKLFLPIEFTKNTTFMQNLSKWLRKHSDVGHEYHLRLNLISSSLPEVELEKIAQAIGGERRIPFEKLNSITLPVLEHFYNYNYYRPSLKDPTSGGRDYELNQKDELFTINASNSIIVTSKPLKSKWIKPSEYYMTDLHIQESKGNQKGFLFPYRKDLGKSACNSGISRIDCSGQISVLREYEGSALIFSPPNENDIFINLLRSNNYNASENKITKIKISDKGQYLKGLIELFGGLDELCQFVSIEYWDKMFKILAGIPDKKENASYETVRNRLNKKLQEINNGFLQTENGINYLTNLVVDTSTNFKENGTGIQYKTFERKAKQDWDEFLETEDYKELASDDTQFDFSENEVKTNINKLISMDVLQVGTAPKCSKCGTKQWVAIEKIKQKTICAGCNNENSISAEEPWMYKLNAIVETSYRENIIPVALALNQLSQHTNSFIYKPAVEVFFNNESNPFTDLDIICIEDGQFMIGEVKKSQSCFKPNDFDKLIEVAKIIRPDKVIISALDITNEDPLSNTITSGLFKMQEALQPIGTKIDVIRFSFSPIEKSNLEFSICTEIQTESRLEESNASN